MAEPCDLGADESRRLIGARALGPVELLDSCIARIEAVNPALNAMVATDFERARAQAKAAEAAVTRGDALGPLHGLPVGIKDLQETAGLRTTHGSPIYADHHAQPSGPSGTRPRGACLRPIASLNAPARDCV